MKKVIVLILLALNLFGADKSGTILIENMREYQKKELGNKFDERKSYGFKNYIVATGTTMALTKNICMSKDTSVNQIIGVVIKYINNNPKEWNYPASYLAMKPLFIAFNCSNKK